MLKFNQYVSESNNLEDDKVLQDIRYFKGNFKEFKDWFDAKAGQNTNAFNDYDKKYPKEEGEQTDTQPVYQTFGIVNLPKRNR